MPTYRSCKNAGQHTIEEGREGLWSFCNSQTRQDFTSRLHHKMVILSLPQKNKIEIHHIHPRTNAAGIFHKTKRYPKSKGRTSKQAPQTSMPSARTYQLVCAKANLLFAHLFLQIPLNCDYVSTPHDSTLPNSNALLESLQSIVCCGMPEVPTCNISQRHKPGLQHEPPHWHAVYSQTRSRCRYCCFMLRALQFLWFP